MTATKSAEEELATVILTTIIKAVAARSRLI